MYDIYVRLDTLDTTNTKDEVLWNPDLTDRGYVLYSASLELKLNHSGKLTFQMSPNHPLYGQLKKRKTRVVIERNGIEIWRGRVLDSKTDFYKRRTVVCEGMLSWLLDGIQRPYSFSGTIKNYINFLLTNYNKECDSDKSFQLGNITAVDGSTEISISNLTPSDYPSTLDELNDKLVNQYGGYLKARYDEAKRSNILDYLSTSGEIGNQKIEFGKNLLDLEDYITAENVYTRCIPLGATYRSIEDFKEYQDPDYVSDLKDEDADKRLTISELYSDGRDYIENATAMKLFGKNTGSVVFDNIVTAKSLKSMGEQWLSENIAMNISLSIKALDLSLLTSDVDAIDYGVAIEVVSEPHEVDMFMTCSELTLNLLAPTQTEYTFGAGFNALTDKQASSIKQSSKAFTVATSANTSAKSVSSNVNSGNYVTTAEFNGFRNELNETLKDIDPLPTATSLDNGKVLKVVNGQWTKGTDETGEAELPTVTESDNGKILRVVNGAWTVSNESVSSGVSLTGIASLSIHGEIAEVGNATLTELEEG